ncbi:MAG: hypothetical protein GY749_22780 [Desulfobacteraceae bacterium]|nr:hypothetical protein [Desulfobacteraceae bacterium]
MVEYRHGANIDDICKENNGFICFKRCTVTGSVTMIEFHPANLVDIRYIVKNLRQSDRDEIYCQFDDEELLIDVAMELGSTICRFKDEPVAAISFTPLNLSTVSVNLFGTDKVTRAIPEITRFIFTQMIPDALGQGVRRFEARSIATHTKAHNWMESAGFVREGVLEQMGVNGERFYMYAITKSILENDNFKRKRWQV